MWIPCLSIKLCNSTVFCFLLRGCFFINEAGEEVDCKEKGEDDRRKDKKANTNVVGKDISDGGCVFFGYKIQIVCTRNVEVTDDCKYSENAKESAVDFNDGVGDINKEITLISVVCM